LGKLVIPTGYLVRIAGPERANRGLVAHWKFDERQGNTVLDTSGNAYGGRLEGPVRTSGKFGGGLRFDGSDDHVKIGGPDIPPPWTAAFWVRRDDSHNANAVLMESSAYVLAVEQFDSTNKVGFTRLGDRDYAFDYEAPIAAWVHLTFVGTGSTTALYVNGRLQETLDAGIGCPMGSISSWHWSVKGVLDDVRIYNRALSETEVGQLHRLGVARR
jgi:hypothetical protein